MSGEPEHRGVAIIGMACRFPGAHNPSAFWKNLCDGVDSIRHFDEAELLNAGVSQSELNRDDYVKASPVLDDIDKFDAAFFEYSPREARLMDPQQRLLLEIAWHAFEDAGYVPGEIAQRVGAFVGSGGVVSSYLLAQAALHGGTTGGVEHLANDKDFLSTKLSYKLGLTGPSVNVQTACSTALVATHMACQSILDGECEMAIAGGSVVRVPHLEGYIHRAGDILSPDGRCRAYDAEAEGTVFGSGAGIVVLKHVEDAIADGDRIYAVILGSAINNDGGEKLSYTASSTTGQQQAMDAAFAAAEVSPSSIGYVEGHGTGTVVGDPLEVEALRRCFSADANATPGSCYLGSVKTNIGHLEQAAGIASLIKATLSVYHQKIPQTLNFNTPNPRMGLDRTPFSIPTQTEDWPTRETPRRAAVNSLGLGGTNAFAVLQQAPVIEEKNSIAPSRPSHLLALSAHSKPALLNLATQWREHLQDLENDQQLSNGCYSATRYRKRFKHRLAVTAADASGLIEKLARVGEPVTAEPSKAKLAFLFPGQGAQRADMARQFYDGEPAFRAAFDQVSKRLLEKFDLDIVAALYDPAHAEELDHTRLSQPAIFAVEFALASMLQNWGLKPHAVLGHSVGAYAAAVVAGIYEVDTATDLIAHRARIMGDLPPGGAMCALFADVPTVQEICDKVDGVAIATMNSPVSTVVAGEESAVQQAIEMAAKADIPARQLPVSHAFHSPLMQPAVTPFKKEVDKVDAAAPQISFVSDMTGEVLVDAPDGDYLSQHILRPVNFAKGLEELRRLGCTDFIEVGPGSALRSFTAASAANLEAKASSQHLYGMLDDQGQDHATASDTLGRLFERGYPVDFDTYYGDGTPLRADIPTYPFDRQRYWLDQNANGGRQGASNVAGQQLKLPGASAVPGAAAHFQTSVSGSSPGWLPHHKVYETITLPVAAALVGFMEAAQPHLTPDEFVEIRDLTYQEACLVQQPEEGGPATENLLNFETPGDFEAGTAKLYGLRSTEGADWQTHCEAKLTRTKMEPRSVGDLRHLQRQHERQISPATYYRALDQLGLNYDVGFRNLQQIFLGEQSALGLVTLSSEMPKLDSPMHPALLDACLHLFPAATGEYGDFGDIADLNTTYLPITIERFAVYRDVPEQVWSHCRARADDQVAGERYCVDIDVYAEDGTPVATLAGLTIKQFTREAFLPEEADNVANWLYGVDWVACPSLEASEGTESSNAGQWLVISDEPNEVGDLLKSFEVHDQSFEILSSDQVKDGQELPLVSGQAIRGIINAAALSSRPLALLNSADLTAETQRQFDLSQAVLKLASETLADADVQPKIWYLTRGAQAPVETLLGGEAIQAVLWGHGRAIAQEHPNVWGGLIDIDEQTRGDDIVAELLAADLPDTEDQIALRQGERYAPRLARRDFDAYLGPVHPPIKPDASYLITGGLGALGLKVAQWLVEEQGARHLWLVSRRSPNEEAQADIAALEELGASIHVVSADIANSSDVAQMVTKINDQGPSLDGLFHCAGLLDDGIMIEMEWERYHRVTAAKIEGSWTLHQVTEKMGLNHFVLFSSILSVIGSMGQLNYVAGNAFLDSLVNYRRRLGLPAVAMNWGPWENAGLAVESGERGEAIWRARGTRFIPVDIGLQAMNAALLNGQDHLVVTHTDWSRFVGQFARPPKLYEKLAAGQSGSNRQLLEDLASTLDKVRSATAPEQSKIVAAAIAQICTVNLELSETPDPDLSLREVGLDSLMSITVINDIENVLGVRLPARQLLKGPSINELTMMVLEDLPTKVEIDSAPLQEDKVEGQSETIALRINKQSGSWLVVQKPRPEAKMRLICFPFAGGGSAVFDEWGEAIDPDIEIISVEAPGRLGRIDEEPVRTIEEFARGLYPELRDKLDRPYAMLGHCLGGLTLYEMLRFFQARRDPMPQHVFVSGARPPSVLRAPGSFEAELNERLTAFGDYKAGRLGHQQPDDVFAEIVRAFGISESSKMLEVEELRQLVLPTVRAEFEMTSRYIYLPERPFGIPITCFRGSRDEYVKRAHAALWEKFTTNRFEMFERDTGHFAIVEDFEFIRSVIEERLLSSNAASA